MNFDKYFEYIKEQFASYEKIKVRIYAQWPDGMIVRIVTKYPDEALGVCGFLEIKFDEETIGFFGSYFGDEYVDDFDNSWEKYTEKQIYDILDKKIIEYKYYIENGYYAEYYDINGERHGQLPFVIKGSKINEEFLVKLYDRYKGQLQFNYKDIKTITVSDFYGDIVIDKLKVNS